MSEYTPKRPENRAYRHKKCTLTYSMKFLKKFTENTIKSVKFDPILFIANLDEERIII